MLFCVSHSKYAGETDEEMKVFHSEHNGCEANFRLSKKEMAYIINNKEVEKKKEEEVEVHLDKSGTTLATVFLVNEN